MGEEGGGGGGGIQLKYLMIFLIGEYLMIFLIGEYLIITLDLFIKFNFYYAKKICQLNVCVANPNPSLDQ